MDGVATYQMTSKSEKKLFVDVRTDEPTDTPEFSKSIRSGVSCTYQGPFRRPEPNLPIWQAIAYH